MEIFTNVRVPMLISRTHFLSGFFFRPDSFHVLQTRDWTRALNRRPRRAYNGGMTNTNPNPDLPTDIDDQLDGPLAAPLTRDDERFLDRAFDGAGVEPSTPEGDLLSLLNTDATRQRTRKDEEQTADDPEERHADFWAYQTKRRQMTMLDLLPARCLVAWRLSRHLLKKTSILGDAERMDKLDAVQDWRRSISTSFLPEFHHARSLPEGARLANEDRSGETPGMSICVPPVPLDDEDDQLLKMWCGLMRVTGDRLRVRDGGTDIDLELSDAFMLITSATRAREAWPTLGQLVIFEDCLIKETLMSLVETSVLQTESSMILKYGISSDEARTLSKLARAEAREFAEIDPEEQRGLLILQVEDIKRRARESFDYRAEIAAVKQISGLLGLEQNSATNPFSEMVDIIKEESSKRKSVDNIAGQKHIEQGD